jgi:hypothetical protein
MDEYNSGMDPEMRKYFRKIINSFSIGLLWLLSVATAGLYFNLAIIHTTLKWYNLVFYLCFFISLTLLLKYLYAVWKRR